MPPAKADDGAQLRWAALRRIRAGFLAKSEQDSNVVLGAMQSTWVNEPESMSANAECQASGRTTERSGPLHEPENANPDARDFEC